jgi:hypothetical protein
MDIYNLPFKRFVSFLWPRHSIFYSAIGATSL